MRAVELPQDVSGHLYLHSMPGRYERFADACTMIADKKISRVVCLAPQDEIRKKSPEYHAALSRGVPWSQVSYSISNYGVPDDRAGFMTLAKSIAEWLGAGESVLIHCGAGIGRTGTLAVAVLLALGLPLSRAQDIVTAADSRPETNDQWELLKRLAAGEYWDATTHGNPA